MIIAGDIGSLPVNIKNDTLLRSITELTAIITTCDSPRKLYTIGNSSAPCGSKAMMRER